MEDRKRNLIIIVGSLVLVLLVGLGIILNRNHKTEYMGESSLRDNLKFKDQYESLNGKKNSAGQEYLKVEVAKDNPIVYKTDAEILDVLNKESAIVFFGYASDPWSRGVVEPLLQIAADNGIDKVYYVDIENIRDTYSIEKGKLKQKKKGTDAYYKILDFLGDKLDAYYLYDEENKEYATGVSRLEPATVISVKGGKVMDYHKGTVISQKDPFKALTETQRMELLGIYQNLYEPINANLCPDGKCEK